MKNNKGYYSWIHSMKNAAMESHFKGRQIINEEKAKKASFDAAKFAASMPTGPVAHGKPDIDPNVVRAAAQVLAKEPTTPHSISLAGGDAAEYAKIRREKHAEKLKDVSQAQAHYASEPYQHDLKPTHHDVDMDGDVDAEDSVEANTFKAAIDTRKAPPSFPWAHQEDEDEMAERHAHMEAEYEANKEAEHEGIEGIIDRMLRGKK
jgi:hypothetical protein